MLHRLPYLYYVLCTRILCNNIIADGTAHGEAYYGRGSSLLVKMSDVSCTGDERSILECPYNSVHSELCDHSRDAGVFCFGGNVMMAIKAVTPIKFYYLA